MQTVNIVRHIQQHIVQVQVLIQGIIIKEDQVIFIQNRIVVIVVEMSITQHFQKVQVQQLISVHI